MSPTIARAIQSRVSSRVARGLALTFLVACHQRSVSSTSLSPADAVPVGYGERSRQEVGGGVRSLVVHDSTNVKARQVEELLIGRFPGVHVRRTPGGFSVRIRGASSFTSNEEPLYVVDGLPVHVTAGRGLNWLNPSDVVRIDVLKDPAQTSMYGVRGAHGVILITTKRGR